MRVLKSRRGKDGYNYHTCPISNENVYGVAGCRGCMELHHMEELPATYRVHCKFDAADELIQIKPAKAAAKIPPSLGTDPLSLSSHRLMEPKLDGVRIFMHIGLHGNRLTTRRKNKAGLYNEVTDQLSHLAHMELSEFAGSVLDGEIIMRSKGTSAGSLGSTMSVIGASPEKALAYQKRWGYVQYQVFDMLFCRGDDIRKQVLAARNMYREDMWRTLGDTPLGGGAVHIRLLESAYVKTQAEKEFFLAQSLAQGYEGAILKDLEATYGQLRGWIKIKEKHTLDLQIVEWEPGKAGGKHAAGLGSLVMAVRMPDGSLKEVTVVSPGTDAQRTAYEYLLALEPAEILAENLIAEVEFQNWTKEYRLRHPRVLRYRHDRSEPSVVDFDTVKRS